MLDAQIRKIIDEASTTMDKTFEHLVHELQSVRAGRASPTMIESVKVEAYGTQMPLNQVASISSPQPDLLVVQPWDLSVIGSIEKAIMSASMGLNPSNDGTVVRVPVPPLSEERRQDLVKAARARGEEAKVSIRNIRRHAKDDVKACQQKENLSEDMLYEGEESVQKITDSHIEKIDALLDRKEAEIMEV